MENKVIEKRILRYASRGNGNILLYAKQGLNIESLVNKVLRTYLCTGDRSENCNCPACSCALENNPDVRWIRPQKNKLLLDDLAELEAFGECYPSISRVKVVVLDGIENASEQAENMLLKSMEESKIVRFVCLAYSHKVRETIVSRCTSYEIFPLSYPEFASYSKQIPGWKAEETPFWYCACAGCPGNIDRIVGQGKQELYQCVYSAYLVGDTKKMLEAMGLLTEKDRNSIFQKNRDEISGVLAMLFIAACQSALGEISSIYSHKQLEKHMSILRKEREAAEIPGYTQGQLLNAILLL